MSKKKCIIGMLVIGLIFSLGIVSSARKIRLEMLDRVEVCSEETAKKLEQAFEKEFPDIDMDIGSLPSAKYQDQIVLLTASGQLSADVILSVVDYRLNVFVDAGIIMPLDGLVEKSGIDISKYPQNLFQACSRNGKLYGFPKKPMPRGTVNYNQDLLDAVGIPYIAKGTTWKEFKIYLEKLTLKDADGNVQRYGCLNKYPQLDLLYLFGGRIVDDHLNPTKVLFGKDYVKILGEFLEMVEEGSMMPLPIYKALGGSKPKIFAEEKVATIITHLGYRGGFQTCEFRWDAELIPAPGGNFGGAHVDLVGWNINAKTENPEAAFKFIQWYLFSPNAQIILESQHQVNTNSIPYAPELQESFAKIADQRQPSNWRCLYEAQEKGVFLPVFENSTDFFQEFWASTWDVLYDRAPVESLLDAEAECQKLLDEALAK